MAMAESHKLPVSEVSRIKTWIDQGAKLQEEQSISDQIEISKHIP
jgi:hypothetical protein